MKHRPLWVKIIRMLFVALIFMWSAFPILIVVVSSFKLTKDIFASQPKFLFVPTLQNYVLLNQLWPQFFENMFNSLIITLGATLLTIIVTTMAGYVYSRFRNTILAASAFFIIFIRMLPPIVITIPLFPLVNILRINDTHLVLIILYATFFVSLSTYIMKAFIDQVPKSLEEMAFVDGANLWQTLTRITLPLTVQGIIASAVFVFIFSWNEFLFAFIFTTTEAKTTPLIISEMLGAVIGVDWGPVFAAATLQLLPIVIFVILVQKFLIAGLSAGAVKG